MIGALCSEVNRSTPFGMYPATRSVTLRILPRSNATPTTVDRNVLVTLNVMSARAGVAPFRDDAAAVNDQSVCARRAARAGPISVL